ncbi:hypothetical protein [Polyangium fumosum]|uniref:Uncharacterized protein n=1 Tax=Polyangium fumosum TaxID=889272 RepID=A0A4U1IB50_9BACT|nr:hypothetical protein [Polyangium fumosum]TKC90772.1 hypothetical protein E8A74_50775 [Polyangium fumosum]
MRKSGILGLLGLAIGLTTALPASAGVEECGNIRFQGLSNCEVRVTAQCTAGCSEFGIYKTACATKLTQVCGDQCTLSAMPTCTDNCTVQCKSDCDNGVNVICSHNCFEECTARRDTECAAKADPAQCAATWDANCDNECDAKCVTVDGGCYQHCVECCGGSCSADANMDCQYSCQDVEFEECEQEFRANCEASCTGDGALFCDGKYIIAGSQVPTCLKALAAQGIEVKAEGSVTIGPDGINGNLAAGICSYSPGDRAAVVGPFALFAAATAGWLARRRKRDSRAER